MVTLNPAIRNITISGKVATGSSTLMHNLEPILQPLGWKFYSGGDFVREHCKELGLKLEDAAARGDDFARSLDTQISNRLKNEEKLVIESWLAGFDAHNIAGVFKILLICPDEGVIIDRVVNRDGVTVDAAKEHIRVRTQENIKKWQRLYGPHDFWDPKRYDLVIDTYKNGPSETLEIVLRELSNSQIVK